jgi:hypothetical protein
MIRRKLCFLCFGLALAIPILTAILNPALPGGTVGMITVGPTSMVQQSGSFAWRFFQWHIFGDNDVITRFGLALNDTFGVDVETGSEIGNLVNVFFPTLFHLSLVFDCGSRYPQAVPVAC